MHGSGFIIISPLFIRQVAHWVSTSFHHSCRSFASRAACSQLRFRAWSSASAVLLQVDLGRPLFLLPSGVHLRTTFEMLVVSLRNTWPTNAIFFLQEQSPCPPVLSVWRAHCWRSFLAKRYARFYGDRKCERFASSSDHAQSFSNILIHKVVQRVHKLGRS